MKLCGLFVYMAVVLGASSLPFQESAFEAGDSGIPKGWTVWSPRPEITPKTFVDTSQSLGGTGSLAIAGSGNAAAFGGWVREIHGIKPGTWYRLTAHYRAEKLSDESRQVLARLDWRRQGDKRAGQPDYAYRVTRNGEWKEVILEAPAPEGAGMAKIQLYLQNAPSATVWWDKIALEEIPAPAPRKVKVAAINYRPRGPATREENVSRFLAVAAKTVPNDTDLILFPEGMTIVGTGKTYSDVAEEIPGPSTYALSELAKKKNSYVAAGIYEREGRVLYNTAILLDRKGSFVGKYRKVYLPREEFEGGLTPGNEYPVFQTDFGKVGILICYDLQYADPARALALQGARLLLMPIWGGNVTLSKARAIENHVFIASAGYD
ncbi:MAG: carbon-nitrogen hydrolase family protein, partial [Bryobacteraceae bacterium]